MLHGLLDSIPRNSPRSCTPLRRGSRAQNWLPWQPAQAGNAINQTLSCSRKVPRAQNCLSLRKAPSASSKLLPTGANNSSRLSGVEEHSLKFPFSMAGPIRFQRSRSNRQLSFNCLPVVSARSAFAIPTWPPNSSRFSRIACVTSTALSNSCHSLPSARASLLTFYPPLHHRVPLRRTPRAST